MARLARAIIPGLPHHVTQRGNERAQTFFSERDNQACLDLLVKHCRAASVQDLGNAAFLRRLEEITGRYLIPGKRRPKPKTK